ncbi:HNH endonuclease [Oceanicola sp. 22II-s10i]|uniref:HNH endonuclease n=1 Tax=Oceanicola sp. 22II-s10i TaxID=1317116 RepID=UPI000B5253B8|nr:HNH endonuclease signature motif containing protein [Oceanicola sp. 22II-s10i]OWU83816.1 HNH endonuclease [Oceanicola sp. 22II-s10i]
MGRLKSLGGQIDRLSSRVRYLPRDHDLERKARNPGRAWYGTARWQRLRWAVLVRDLFTCAKCGRVEGQTSQLVADHIEPHRGDPALFWDEGNLQCLCKPCHDSEKQREERGGRR